MTRSTTIAYSALTTTILAGFVAFFVVLQPQINTIRVQQQQLEQTRQELTQQEAFLGTIDQKLQQLQANQQHENQLALILPADERSEDYLRIIHQSSGISGVTIGRLVNQSNSLQSQLNSQVARGASAGLPEFIQPVGWQLDFSGTYQQFRSFLQELERSPRLIDIQNIRISRNEDNPSIVSGQMTTQFYQYIPPEESSS